MPISNVVFVAGSTTNVNSGVNSPAANASAPAGVTLVVNICVPGGGTITALSDSGGAGNVYVQAVANSASTTQDAIWYCQKSANAITGGSTTWNATVTGGTQYNVICVGYVTGALLGLDQTGTAGGTSLSTLTVTASGSLSSANEIAFVAGNTGTGYVTYTEPTGWTEVDGSPITNHGGNVFSYQITSSTTAPSYQGNWTNAGTQVFVMATFIGNPVQPPNPLTAIIWKQDGYVPPPDWVSTSIKANTLWKLLSPLINKIPGKAQQKLWRYDLVPETMWYSYKPEWMNSAVIQQLSHQVMRKIGGEVQQKFWRYDPVPETMWYSYKPEWMNSAVIQMLDHKPTAPQKFWRYDYDSSVVSNTASLSVPHALFPMGNPFTPLQWAFNTDTDTRVWSWQDLNVAVSIQALSLNLPTPPFYATKPSGLTEWLGTPLTAFALEQPQQSNPFHKQWRYDTDTDVRTWLAAPIANTTVNLTPQSHTAIRGPLYTQRPVPPPDWQWQAPYALNPLNKQQNPFFKLWRYDTVPQPDWLPTLDNLNANTLDILIVGGNPFQKLWRYDTDTDVRTWAVTVDNLAANTLFILDFKPTAPQKLWRYDVVPQPDWVVASAANTTINLTPFPKTLVLAPFWADTYVPPPDWSPALANLSVPPIDYPTHTPLLPPQWLDLVYTPPDWLGVSTAVPLSASSSLANQQARAPFYTHTYVPPPDWFPTPRADFGLLTASFTPFSKLWRYDYVPPPDWVALTEYEDADALQLLDYKPTSPPRFWHHDQVPPPDWVGHSTADLNLTILSAQVTLPFSKLWRWDYDPPPPWMPPIDNLTADTLVALDFKPRIPPQWLDLVYTPPDWRAQPTSTPLAAAISLANQQVRAPLYTPHYVPPPDWLGEPLATSVNLTTVKPINPALPFEAPFWAPTRQEQAQYFSSLSSFQALNFPGVQAKPFAKLWRWDLTPPPDWLWEPPPAPALGMLDYKPRIPPLWSDLYVPPTEWVGQAVAPRQAFLSTSVQLNAFKLWRWDLQPAPDWVWTPPFSPVIQQTAYSPTSPAKQWRWDYDPAPPWMPQIENLDAYLLLKLAVQPIFPPLWSNTFVPAAEWVGRPTTLGLFQQDPPSPPLGAFFPPLWSDTFVPATEWLGHPTASYAFLPKVPNVALMRYVNYVPPPDWLWTPPFSPTIMELASGGNPYHRLWRWDQVPATEWVGAPHIVTQAMFTAQTNPNFRLWRWDLVEQPQVIVPPLGSSLSARTAFLTPNVAPMRRADYVAPPNWLVFLQYAWALIMPPAPVEDEGHAWRRLLAFTVPGAVLNRDVPRFLAERRDPDEDDIITWLLGDL
jgi:hypothetical protein